MLSQHVAKCKLYISTELEEVLDKLIVLLCTHKQLQNDFIIINVHYTSIDHM